MAPRRMKKKKKTAVLLFFFFIRRELKGQRSASCLTVEDFHFALTPCGVFDSFLLAFTKKIKKKMLRRLRDAVGRSDVN